MLWEILNKSWRQPSIKQQVYGHLPPIMKTILVRWTRHVGHSGRSKDELISNILLWTPSNGRAKAGQQARMYIQQLCFNTGYSHEDLLGAIDDRDGWWERVREICDGGMTWWWNCVLMLKWIVWNRTDYLYKIDLTLNSQQRWICHKIQTTMW